jgi:hypothetical protein
VAIVVLSSAQARWITGTTVSIDGAVLAGGMRRFQSEAAETKAALLSG